MGVNEKERITTEELIKELKSRGKTSEEILEFLYSNEEGYAMLTDSDEETKESRIMQIVTDILLDLGVPAHIKGYSYVRKAIISVAENPDYLGSMTTVLNPEIAKEFDSTPSRVERAIRHAIEVAWERGKTEMWIKHFGCTVTNLRKKPTNSEFIAMIADMIRLKYMR